MDEDLHTLLYRKLELKDTVTPGYSASKDLLAEPRESPENAPVSDPKISA